MAQPSAEHLQFRFGVATPACRTIRTLLEISQAGGFLFALMFQTITLMDGMFNADAGHPGRVRGLETTRNESCMAFVKAQQQRLNIQIGRAAVTSLALVT